MSRFPGIPVEDEKVPPPRFAGTPVKGPTPVDKPGFLSRAQWAAPGFTQGLARMAGAPVDIMALPAHFFGYEGVPVGGSESILGGLQKLGLGQDAPPEGRFAQRVGEEVGAASLPVGLGLTAARMGAQGPRLLRPIIDAARTTPARFAGAELVSGAAGGTGAAIAQEVAPGSLPAELLGQTLGALTPSAASGLARVATRGPSSQTMAKNIQTFERAGVDPTAGQAAQTVPSQAVEGILRGVPGARGVMVQTAERQGEQMGSMVGKLTQRMAPRIGPETAGRKIGQGFGRFVESKQGKAAALWGRVDNIVAPEAAVGMPQTKTLLETMTGKGALAESFNNPVIAKAAKAAATGDTIPYQELRDVRSIIGARLGGFDLISDIPRRDLKRLYGALTGDIKTAAIAAAGDTGRRTWDRANTFTSALHGRVDDMLEPIAKRASPEKVFQAVRTADASTLRAVKRSLEPAQWRVVAASVAQDLGKARAFLQDDVGEIFSPETFLTQWNKLAPEVRSLLFSGKGLAAFEKDLQAIAKTAANIRASREVLKNPSGTAPLLLAGGATGLGATRLMAGDVVTPGLLALSAISANGAAHLMTNPRFVRWLAKSAAVPPERLEMLIIRMSQSLTNEPERAAATEYLGALRSLNNK